MTPELIAWAKYMAIAPLIPALLRWLGSDHGAADAEEVAQANEVVLDALSDADEVRGIELHTAHNLRDQLSVEDAERLAQEAEESDWKARGWWN